MKTHLTDTDTVAATAPATTRPRPALAAIKARAKALKEWRRHERIRMFFGWCASYHALGFSF